MSPSRPDRHSLQRALVLSIALHLCAAAFIVVSSALTDGSGSARSGGYPLETMRVSYLTISHRSHTRPRQAKVVALRPTSHAAPPRPQARHANPRTATPAVVETTRSEVDGRRRSLARGEARASQPRTVLQRLALPLAVTTERPERMLHPSPTPGLATSPPAPAAVAVSPSTSATPAPQPESSTPAPSEQVAARGMSVPPGGWGQSFEHPLVADESALETLRARYHASAQVRVEVDETGRATRVSVPANLPDDVRAALERRLLELRYVPAECNGLRCTGILQVVL